MVAMSAVSCDTSAGRQQRHPGGHRRDEREEDRHEGGEAQGQPPLAAMPARVPLLAAGGILVVSGLAMLVRHERRPHGRASSVR